MTELLTRLAVGTDVTEVAGVHRWSRASYYGTPVDFDDGREDMWAHLLGEPGRVTHVAEVSGTIVGFMSAMRLPELDRALEMSSRYVLPTHAGQGTGSRLHQLFEDERRSGEAGVLEVWAGNDRAIEFYRRRGWIPTPTTRPGPRGVDFVTYRLPARLTA